MSEILKEGERLWNLGFAILWIKPKSKAPVRSKWSSGPRESWPELRSSYRPGYNIGVRLGTPSRVGNGTLSILDVDVKSTDEKHQKEAVEAVRTLFPEIKTQDLPHVLSGRGNGSGHIYLITQSVMRPQLLMRSPDRVRVLMPSSPSSNASKAELSVEDINEGWRMRPAWEVAIMGEGQQALLPPSIHPDTGKAYLWDRPFKIFDAVRLENVRLDEKSEKTVQAYDWSPALETEVDGLLKLLPENLQNTIREGGSNPDRSGALFGVSIALVKEGWSTHEIQSLLTDRRYELGRVAYDHTKSSSRTRAADWVFNYTLAKAKKEAFDTKLFEREIEIIPLAPEEAEAQTAELLKTQDWKDRIERFTGNGQNAGSPKPTLKNVILILTEEVAPDLFKHDSFASRDFYGYDTPWGGFKGKSLTDDDALLIKVWLGQRYRFEPPTSLIEETMKVLSHQNAFDPVREMLEALPPWDGILRLDTWLAEHFEAEGHPEYLAQVFRKWMFAMVLRVYEPGARFDWMIILDGDQDKGKSSFGEILAGQKYFLDWLPDLNNKDAALSLQGSWCIEMGELASLKNADLEASKAFIVRKVDKVRPPYGRRLIECYRRCVFFGTTNRDTYLKDDTGNRRFKPVLVGQLDFRALERDRDQLLAEALFLYKNELEGKVRIDTEGEAKIYENFIHSEKMVKDESWVFTERLREFIEKEKKKPEKERFSLTKFKLLTLFEGQGPWAYKEETGRNIHFASKALKNLGAKHIEIKGLGWWSLI